MPVASIEIEVVHAPALNLAMEHAGVPLVRDIVLRNCGAELLHDARLSLQLTPELGDVRLIDVPDLHPGDIVHLGAVEVRAAPGRLRRVLEAERARLEWRLRCGTEESARGEGDVAILAYNEWPASIAPELLVSFVTPNHPVIMSVLRRVADRLAEATGDGSLTGYQSHSKARVKQTLEALYQTVQGLGIGYVDVPASFTGLGQKVRLPDHVLAEQLGDCVDLSVLFSSCLEQMGLRPLLILVKGHAFLAVWLIDDLFPEGAIEDAARLRSQIALGNVLPFDATVAVAASNPAMEAAVAAALERLGDDAAFERALDVRALRAKYLPLPIRDVAREQESDVADSSSRVEVRRILAEALKEPEPPPLPAEPAAPEIARFLKWEEKLLDLTLRNRLLSFNLEARTTLPLEGFDLAAFEDRFAADESFEIIARPDSDAIDSTRLVQRDATSGRQLAEEFNRGRLRSSLTADTLWSRAIRLERDARTAIEESGASTLFVAIGVLRWFETKESEKPRLAPLLLYPARLDFDRRKRRVQVRRTEQDPITNVTLVEKMTRDFDVDLASMATLDPDQSGVDISLLLRRAREAIQRMPRWEVLDIACVGLYSFSKFLMWKDLHDNGDTLLRNPVVKHLAMGEGAFVNAAEAILPERIDADVPPDRLPCVVDADSTQMAAVANALCGRSFVLQGPPGTGKSQTITNLIAAALSEGKTVLFVAEKMAALDVVQRRLSEVGLGDFCLELHSNKANKKAVLDSLAAVLNRRERTEAPPWAERCRELAGARTELNAYAEALHRRWPLGLSFHEASAKLLSLADAPDVRVTFERIAEWTGERFRGTSQGIAEHAARAAVVEPVAANPWRACQLEAWTSELQEEIADALSTTTAALERVEVAAKALGLNLGMKAPTSTLALDFFVAFSAAVADGPLPPAVTSIVDAAGFGARMRAYVKMKSEQDSSRAALDQRWTNAFYELDLLRLGARYEKWKSSLGLIALVVLVGARRELKRVARGSLPARDQVASDLALASKVRERQRAFDEEREWLTKTLGRALPEDVSALSQLGDRCTRAVEAAAALKRHGSTEADLITASQAPAAVVRGLQIELREALSSESAAEHSVQQLLGIGTSAWPDRASGWHRADLRRLIDGLAGALGSLRAWCLYRHSANSLSALGLASLDGAHAEGRVCAETLHASFQRAFLSRWVAAVRASEPSLRAFDGAAHHRLVERFRTIDREHIALSRQVVVSRLEGRLPSAQTRPAESSELGILLRETHKKARHLPIRRLLHDIQRLLPHLKPCLLMSPLSIAQYLPADGTRFDLVVFDEASQIGTHDAIGAIARGNQVVIVGDSKQLPPTTFFQRQGEDDEDDRDENDIHELESVLEEAEAKQIPQQRLGWHYRSRHETLIDFSNRHYYDRSLHVFPAAAAESDVLGVSWRHVPDGLYEAGGRGERARTNLREAQVLVDELVALLQRYKPEERTFGVVTFSLPQQSLVQDLLDEQRARLPAIERHFTGPERVFVKNLENVQGDERDEILFSICYAKDAGGKLRMHFGPLSMSGGERRLNVAVTRARQRLRVFSTLTPEQIDLRRTSSVGAMHLKAFLEYTAHRGRGVDTAINAYTFASEFERQLAHAVIARERRVKTQVGCSGYRIDIAVERPEVPDTFSLAAEGDGPAYGCAKSARDRDRLRQDVLAGLGWTAHRVWSSDWTFERDQEEQRLSAALAIRKPSPTHPASPHRDEAQAIVLPPALAHAAAAVIPATQEESHEMYRPVQILSAYAGQDFYAPSADNDLRTRMLAIVDGEGPVHFDVMAYRLIESWGLVKLTARSRDRIEEAMKGLQRRRQLVQRGAFLWPATVPPETYLRYRLPDGEEGYRPIEYIAPEEIANAAAFVLCQALSIDRDELTRATAQLFGVVRLSRNVAACMDEGICRLETSGRCKVNGSRVLAR